MSNVSAIIQNNPDTSLRIESVVDAATLINSPVAATLLATPGNLNLVFYYFFFIFEIQNFKVQFLYT